MKSNLKVYKKFALGGLAVAFSPVVNAALPPNVLYIMTDQQSYYTISSLAEYLDNSPYADYQYFSTPNLDKLVNRGYSFTYCYAANPVSGPSRFALLTGESPKSYGMNGNYSPHGENGERINDLIQNNAMGSLFRNAGYNTYYAGKVHLPWADGHDGKESIYNPPYAYGFNEYLTFDDRDVLRDTAVSFIEQEKVKEPFLFFISFMNPHDICMSKLLFEPEKRLEDFAHNQREIGARRNQLEFRDLYQSMRQSRFDCDTLARLPENKGVTDYFPYIDIAKSSMYNEHRTRAHLWFYYRLVEQVDGMIGQIIDAIDASPYKDNTVIVFTSDHGEMGLSHGLTGKNMPYEECQRVPFIFAGKNIPQGVTDDTPVCNGWDLLPTILSMSGIDAPRSLKGQNLYPKIKDGREVERKFLFLETVNSYGILEDGRYKYTRFEMDGPLSDNELLVDLLMDPGEMHNLARSADYQNKLEMMRDVLEEKMKEYNVTFKTYRNDK